MNKEKKAYYLGLDIGTESVGYAVTNESYDLMKFHGEPVWGTTTFEAAALAEARRMNRGARRRNDRRKQRTQLLAEIFAPEICAIDPKFFIRRKESALFAEDSRHGVKIFEGGISDKEYHKRYPTIHHLIFDLMSAVEPRDIRFVFMACSWLLENRGHFLSDSSMDGVQNFSAVYEAFKEHLFQEYSCGLPWSEDISADIIAEIMQSEVGVKRKQNMFKERVFEDKNPAKKADEEFPFSRDAIVNLLSGGKVAPSALFVDSESYAEVESISLGMDQDNFDRILEELGDDAALLNLMRDMYDCALLGAILKGFGSISEAKIAVYKQHAKDLNWLKYFIRKYKKSEYNKVFRMAEAENYVAYSYNTKNCKDEDIKKLKKADKEAFSKFLKKIVDNVQVEGSDIDKYNDMLERLDSCTFLPKQKDSDNRVIPQQLYRYELAEILKHAKAYIPMLEETDEDGISNEAKILSIFDFKIPYFVGPLNPQSPFAWLERKTGKIYPWNFEKMVDFDKSEQQFIKRMTNTCTYLPGEDVLPACSLLYSRFAVLNELNNLKINQNSIPVEVKQEIYNNLIKPAQGKISKKKIENYLQSRGYMNQGDEISGIDITMTSSLKSYKSFERLISSGVLTEEQVEDIINHAAYSEDKNRMARWLKLNFPSLSENERKYILRLKLKGFGRLSKKFLTDIMGCEKSGTGEALSIIEALWETNENHNQLLSEKYRFKEQIEAFASEYYSNPENKKTLSERLSDMYISNAVKRPIMRALDITSDVVKAMGCAPQKIFVEMARGATPDQKGKRSVSRQNQIIELYKKIKDEEVAQLKKELEAMGEKADNRLQSDSLFLYYMQLGKCMYTGNAIKLEQLASGMYNIEHIYPKSKVKDESILNNKVLVLSTVNAEKDENYPVDEAIRIKMSGFWDYLKENSLITDEKHRRLTRSSGFSEDELRGFINRQLVETRQSTKAVAQLLKEKYPESELVYVKAGMVSDFRNEFNMLKCRSLNDLHHAKDAYLTIPVGNVYHEMFTKRWFDVKSKYSISIKAVFGNVQKPHGKLVWQGKADVAKAKKTMAKNAVHLTRYSFIRSGGLFDQLPLKANADLIPRKKELPSEKYGGYNKPTASFYLLVSYTMGKKKDIIFAPVELRFRDRVLNDREYAVEYLTEVISEINGGKKITDVNILLNGRIIKINTVLSLDGMLVTIRAKSNKGAIIIVSNQLSLTMSLENERYVKRLEAFSEKKKKNSKIVLNEEYDHISKEENLRLFGILKDKLKNSVFAKCPGNIYDILEAGKERFASLDTEAQVACIMSIVSWFNTATNCNLTCIGGGKQCGAKTINSRLSGMKNKYNDIRIVDMSASGLFVSRSENLLNLL